MRKNIIEEVLEPTPNNSGSYQHNKIFFQAGAYGGVTGFGNLLADCDSRGIPVYAASSSSMNLLYDLQVARQASGVQHKGNFIPTLDAQGQRFDLDYTVYHSEEAAHAAWREFAAFRWQRALQVIPTELDPSITTVSLENEQRPYVGWCQKDHPNPQDPECLARIPGFTGWADCFGWQAYYSGLEAIRLGFAYMAFGFAGGNPEEGAWEQPGMLAYLRLCADNPEKLGVALHEYSFENTLFHDWGNRIGRFQQLHNVCDQHGIRRPMIDIKEFGWRQDTVPTWGADVEYQIEQAADLYARYTNIRGAAIWTTQNGWGNCRERTLGMVQPISEFSQRYRYTGDVEDPDEIAPPDQKEQTYGFEDGWTDDPQQPDRRQIPNKFSLTVIPEGSGLWYQQGRTATGEVECMHKLCSQLPIEECLGGERPLILDGETTFKIQAVNMATGTSLSTTFTQLSGRVQVIVPVQCHYHGEDSYDRSPPLESDDVYAVLLLNGVEVQRLQFPALLDKQWCYLSGEAESPVTAELRFQNSYANSRDLFTDHWLGKEISPEPEVSPPDQTINHTIHLLPQDTNLQELQQTAVNLHPTRSAFTYSADVAHAVMFAGTPQSRVVIWEAERWQGNITAWFNARGIVNVQHEQFGRPISAHSPDLSNAPTPPDPTINHTIHLLPQDTNLQELQKTAVNLHPTRSAFTYSADVAHAVMFAGTPQSRVVIWEAERWQGDITAWFNARGIVNVQHEQFGENSTDIKLVFRPCAETRITQRFGANPQNYPCCPGHDGIDYGVPQGHPYYASAAGVVVHASDRKPNSGERSAYGWHVYVDHGGYHTVYAHAQQPLPVTVGQQVAAGQIVGYSGNTGYSTGYHLHFGLLVPYQTGNGYPMWTYGQAIDPYPYVYGLNAPPQLPQKGSALIGLHASADPGRFHAGLAEFEEFKTLAGGTATAVKILSAHDPDDIERVFQDAVSVGNPVGLWIVRAFLRFDGRQVSPNDFVNWTKDDIHRTITRLESLGVKRHDILLEIHNEPNLQPEGAFINWQNGHDFGIWLDAVISQYRELFSGCPLVYPGLSPGGSISGLKLDDKDFFEQSSGTASRCDYIGVHCYWQNDHALYPMKQAFDHLDWYINKGLPIVITEASNNRRQNPPSTAVYVNDYNAFWRQCQSRPSVAAVTYFVASASDTTFHPECWVVNGRSKGIAAGLSRIING